MSPLRIVFFALIAVVSSLFVGCGPNVRVSGTVSFPDGAPLTRGTVVFLSETHTAKGDLNSSGDFVIGSLKKGDGLPAGKYKVYIASAVVRDEHFIPPPHEPDAAHFISLIDSKFGSPASTPLEFDIAKSEKLDIKVELPTK